MNKLYTWHIKYLDDDSVQRVIPVDAETIGQAIINFTLLMMDDKHELIGIERQELSYYSIIGI